MNDEQAKVMHAAAVANRLAQDALILKVKSAKADAAADVAKQEFVELLEKYVDRS